MLFRSSFLFDYIDNRSFDGHAWGGTRPSAKVFTEARVTQITDDSVTYEKDGKTHTINGVSDVIVAVGTKSVNPFKKKIPGISKVEIVGDAAAAKDGLAATAAGFRVGYYI